MPNTSHTTPFRPALPAGWYYPDDATGQLLHAELLRELPVDHLLHERAVETFAWREGATDDVLFRHADQPERFTVIMNITRRDFIAMIGTSTAVAAVPGASLKGTNNMYGLIGKIKVVPGQRDALISILTEGVGSMPGCLSYIVAQDPTDPDAIWVTEVWNSQDSHRASLSLPSVQKAISRGKPLIAGFGERFETRPVGGFGLGARS